MDIRTKLVFALVAVSLGSMFVFGAITFGVVSEMMEGQAVRQLEAIADAKSEDLERVVGAWKDRVRLVASRTKLREGLVEFRRSGDPKAREEIQRSLDDALGSVKALRGIAVHSSDGHAVATRGLDPNDGQPATFWLAYDPVVYDQVFTGPEGELVVGFVAAIHEGVELIGAAKVMLSAEELTQITDDRSGLGETGETLMARLTPAGGALILSRLRHREGDPLSIIVDPARLEDPAIQAVLGNQDVFLEGAVDYRGEEVWAATRTLAGFDWGLVVKVDRAEELQPVLELRSTMFRLALSLSAFAIVVGAWLGFAFARPIRSLAEVAQRIRGGEHDLRARAGTEDEVGQLASTFNLMAEELIEKNRELERRIEQQHPSPRATNSPP